MRTQMLVLVQHVFSTIAEALSGTAAQMKAAKTLRRRLVIRAEGTGLEPATPCGASDFESDR